MWLHLGPTRIRPLHLEATSVPMLRADDRLDPELADRFLQPGHLAIEHTGPSASTSPVM